MLTPYIGALELNRIHDQTLERFIADRRAEGVTATTINRSLEVVRTILNRAARSYRDAHGQPWLGGLPPLISKLPESRRAPYPITWDEQDRLFPKLPPRLARMALFAVSTGLRESNICGPQWPWELHVPEVGRSVFVIPPEAFKSKRPHVVILNEVAWSIIQAQRGQHPIWVFPYRDRHVATMNNTAWQRARREVGLQAVRIHDLRHTFICRSLLDCYHRNQLPDHIIDTLSTYVGHAKATDTYWYVSATPELMAVAAQRFACFVEGGRR